MSIDYNMSLAGGYNSFLAQKHFSWGGGRHTTTGLLLLAWETNNREKQLSLSASAIALTIEVYPPFAKNLRRSHDRTGVRFVGGGWEAFGQAM